MGKHLIAMTSPTKSLSKSFSDEGFGDDDNGGPNADRTIKARINKGKRLLGLVFKGGAKQDSAKNRA